MLKSVACISTNWDESTSSIQHWIIFTVTHDQARRYIEYLINAIFNNSVKYYVLVW